MTNSVQCQDPTPFADYQRPTSTQGKPSPIASGQGNSAFLAEGAGAPTGEQAALRMYTTMDTWCESCKKALPQLAHLRAIYSERQLSMYGVPIDVIESRKALESYARRYQPAYQLLLDMSDNQRAQLQRMLRRTLQSDVLPSTLVTSEQGTVLAAYPGVPSAPELGKLRIRLTETAQNQSVR